MSVVVPLQFSNFSNLLRCTSELIGSGLVTGCQICAEEKSYCDAAPPQVKLLAEKACQRIPGMRLSSDEAETGITHLILGCERRTMKVPP